MSSVISKMKNMLTLSSSVRDQALKDVKI
jgi:hypothetical protein